MQARASPKQEDVQGQLTLLRQAGDRDVRLCTDFEPLEDLDFILRGEFQGGRGGARFGWSSAPGNEAVGPRGRPGERGGGAAGMGWWPWEGVGLKSVGHETDGAR